jgi:hypothetical protein
VLAWPVFLLGACPGCGLAGATEPITWCYR